MEPTATIVTVVSLPVAVVLAPGNLVGVAHPLGLEVTEPLVSDGEATARALARTVATGGVPDLRAGRRTRSRAVPVGRR